MTTGSAAPSYVLSRWLFLRLLGVVYLLAFVSLHIQIVGLVGRHGLLPAASFLNWAHEVYGAGAYRTLPTLFWLGAGDSALHLVTWAGIGLSCVLILGLAPIPMLAVLWVLYLSVSVIGQDFLSFQWDALLLETGLLAVLWAPPIWRGGHGEPPPLPVVRWLLVLLVFKLMFLSGATKLLSGDPTWRQLTALDYHFQTQPLPTWIGWYAHQLSPGVHRAATAAMFVIELGAPWLLLCPPRLIRARYLGVAALVLLQLGIALTGNYGFFNLLAIVLCVPVLDDALLRRLFPVKVRLEEPSWNVWSIGVHVLAPAVLALSALSFWAEMAYTMRGGAGLVPRWATAVLGWSAPLRSFNGYGLFRVMTTERPELVVEGSQDGEHWSEYLFRYKPGPLARRPGFVEPHHPRLDWQMWFAALDPMSNLPLLAALSRQLRAGSPEVLALMGSNPFPDAPPRRIRFVQYQYRFTTLEERARTGTWWRRDPIGVLPELQ